MPDISASERKQKVRFLKVQEGEERHLELRFDDATKDATIIKFVVAVVG